MLSRTLGGVRAQRRLSVCNCRSSLFPFRQFNSAQRHRVGVAFAVRRSKKDPTPPQQPEPEDDVEEGLDDQLLDDMMLQPDDDEAYEEFEEPTEEMLEAMQGSCVVGLTLEVLLFVTLNA